MRQDNLPSDTSPLNGGEPPLPEHPTVEVVATALACCPATVWRLVKDGKLIRRRYLGRTVFDRHQVEQLAAERGR